MLPDLSNLLNAAAGSKEQTVISNQLSAVSGEPSEKRPKLSTPKRSITQRSPSAPAKRPTANRAQPAAAWRRIDSDVNGEWTYYLILDQFLNNSGESKRAAAGWSGDRYALYEGPAGKVFLAQVAMWDTESDAREFFDAYVRRTELRYPQATATDSPVAGERRAWSSSEGDVVMELRGQRVVILEGIPKGVDANALAKMLWR